MSDFDERQIVRQFLATITAGGITPRSSSFEPMLDGRLHRFPIEGDRGSAKSGGYCIYTDNLPAGWAKDWRNNNTVKFKYSPNDEERREYGRQQHDSESRANSEKKRRESERRKAQEQKLHEENQQASLILALREYLYADLRGVFSHPYLRSKFTEKGIHIEQSTAFNSWDVQTDDEPKDYRPIQRMPIAISRGRVRGGLCKENEVIIPMLNITSGKIQTLIHIPTTRNSKGGFDKPYYKGLSPTGAAHELRPKFSEFADTVLPCEGIATAISLLILTGEKYPVFSAGGCNNLLPVCTGLRKRFPKKKICIMADNDEAGLEAAKKCITAGVADDYRYPPNYKEDFYDYLVRKAGN